MKLLSFLNFVFVSALLGCSGSSHDGGYGTAYDASPEPIAKIELVPNNVDKNELEKRFQAINENCLKDTTRVPTAGLHNGMHQTLKADNMYTDGYGKSHSDSSNRKTIIESITDSHRFITRVNSDYGRYSLLARFSNSITNQGSSSSLIELISTDPPSLKDEFMRRGRDGFRENSYASCTGDSDGYDSSIEEVDVTLKSGEKFRAIRRTTLLNFKNYTCTQYNRADKTVIAQTKIADFAQSVSSEIAAESFQNPFEGCYGYNKILDVYAVFAISKNQTNEIGKTGKVIQLHKTEVIDIK